MANKIPDRSPEDYYIENLKNGSLTPQEMRHEYSLLREIANSRLQRMGNSEFKNSQSYLRNRNKYKRISEIKSERELIGLLHDVKRFVDSKSGSIRGMQDIRNRTLQTAHERGMTFLNKDNLQDFGNFMEDARIRGLVRQYGSERVRELYEAAEKKKISSESIRKEFNYWMTHIDDLENAEKITSKNKVTADDYRKIIGANR